MTPYEKQMSAIVRAFERERDENLEIANQVERSEVLTGAESVILAHAAITALRAAGYAVVPSNHVDQSEARVVPRRHHRDGISPSCSDLS